SPPTPCARSSASSLRSGLWRIQAHRPVSSDGRRADVPASWCLHRERCLSAVDLGLKGRTAIVCGASAGLGLATAEALAGERANVTMFARRREVLEREAERLGALAVRGDVTNPRDLDTVVKRTVEAFGGIDILVWNGGGPPPGRAVGLGAEAIEEAVELLLVPAVRLVELCLPYLVQSEAGRILVFTSIAAKEPVEHIALSNAVRPGVTGWAK